MSTFFGGPLPARSHDRRCGGLGTLRLDCGVPFLSAGFHRHGQKSDDQFRGGMAKH